MKYSIKDMRKIAKIVKRRLITNNVVYIMNKIYISQEDCKARRKTAITSNDDSFDKLTDENYRLFAIVKRSDFGKDIYLKDIEQIVFS